MNHDSTPTQQDHARLRRALFGCLFVFFAFMFAVIGLEFIGPENTTAAVWFGMSYCAVLIVGIVAVCRYPARPHRDQTQEGYVKASIGGRRCCFWFGVGGVGIGLGTFLTLDRVLNGHSVCEIATGLALVFWSSQFPKVAPPDLQEARRWQFSMRTLLTATMLVGLYMGAVVWLSDPEDTVVWRLAQPMLAIFALCFVGYLVTIVILPIRLAWIIATKILRRQRAKGGSEAA